jgi:succinate dehydrogenase / fumarate reductase, cytochrome b subunit
MMLRRGGDASSIGTKVIVGVTGGLLFLFLVLHVSGNLLIFFGPETFNNYSQTLISNPLLIPAEVGLLLVFLIHLYNNIRLTLDNARARPIPYARKRWAGPPSRKSLSSSTMILSGLVVLAFIPVHVKMFKYGPHYAYRASSVRDLYRLELENFSSPLAVGLYVAVMVVVGFHLWHGVSSAFQSLGVTGPRVTPLILGAGRILAVIISAGFVIIAVWALLFGMRL